ncbi:MAG: NAD-dependent epimerase/dehydratase family protein [Bacteroidetes bacterium]|nr:NAD-dependent epimerase/dehydratase family protein [Bacteroidota bacterium]MBV6461311.1 UDP-glucose 4-epimerase [Flavobacteriales bacterium]WKZ75289.1 MAG: NAD-dependent epimerase/dehydratase family protein [Vicingaceae bacterium]MCL4816556.1 NAD-dependent epimerase/dehydratase family protein [Flavobacteriales bacterium]NOG94348.1 NAD-dependent epimerase/dehydratase family protein [Bacteroidota bacterium]
MNKILITGGAGFIASALAEKLSEDAKNFIVIADNLSTGGREKIPFSKHNNIKFIKCDVNRLSDITSVFHAFSFDFVFHYAALVGVKRTLQNPVKVLRDISGIKNILNLSKNTGVKRVYYSSSSEVYGEPVEIPQNELTTPLNSRLPYAIVKNVGEAFLKAYKTEFDLDYTIFRFFNTYGPKQSKDFVVSKFIQSALKNAPITIYGNGSQTRTFCYIDDNIDATTKLFYENLNINEVINIGNDKETSILELAKIILELTKSKSEIQFLPPLEEGDMSRRCPDISKMKGILNRELIPLEAGLKKVLENTTFIV